MHSAKEKMRQARQRKTHVRYATWHAKRHGQRQEQRNRPLSKAELRSDIELQIQAFLDQGGQIQTIQRGQSAFPDGMPGSVLSPISPATGTRTPVPEVTAAIDARKRRRPREAPAFQRRRAAKPRVIYDDFGEPIRKVWD